MKSFINLLSIILLLAITACANPNLNRAGTGVGIGGFPAGSVQEFSQGVGDRIFFETDQSILTPVAQSTLQAQARWLNQYPNHRILIEGHADERGTREYNIALGARRASVTRDFLIANGVSSNRISTTSFGKERPVAVCEDISCWSVNRRAVTALQ